MLGGEVAAITDANDTAPRLVAQKKGRERNRHHYRLQVSWRQVDDQPRYLARTDSFQLIGNCLHVPVLQ